jgi:hypothetical protein
MWWSLNGFGTLLATALILAPALLLEAAASGGVDDLSKMDDYSNHHGVDDLTTMDDYDYSNYNGDYGSSGGAGSNGCSSQLSTYYRCLADNDIQACDTSCAGPAYSAILNELVAVLTSTGSFGSCDSVASYVCATFQQRCECLTPCL